MKADAYRQAATLAALARGSTRPAAAPLATTTSGRMAWRARAPPPKAPFPPSLTPYHACPQPPDRGLSGAVRVATLKGAVLLSAVQQRQKLGLTPLEATLQAAEERLRAVLTTALVAALGFLPMALASGTGAEVQRPLATVVIGGLVTATLATLIGLPALYARFGAAPAADET